jgi:hypothetical protein
MKILLLVIIILGLCLSGCSQQQDLPDIVKEDQFQTKTSAFSDPIRLDLSISKAPLLQEDASLMLSIHSSETVGYIEPWLQIECIPTQKNYLSYDYARTRTAIVDLDDLSISKNTEWRGELAADSILEFEASLKFPYPGKWSIRAFIQNDKYTLCSNVIKIAVENDKSGIYGVDKSGWMQDYAPSVATAVNPPIFTTLDINKPPKLKEEVELTWSITANEDFEKVELWTEFILVDSFEQVYSDVDKEPIYIDGDIDWEGSLNINETVSSKATINFPKEGDWKVLLWMRTPEETVARSVIFLNAGKASGRWGWASTHDIYR